ncbi:MAG TPA: SRPBCC domain-containing protein [Gaiellaceae bacterium]|nr:SRPBCC domain-containing protein [Gaiellaceae bacterium]
MSKAQESGRILGSLGSRDGKGVVRLQDRFERGIGEVWSALTEHARLAVWYGEVEGELRLGGEYHARLFASGWEGTGRIEACRPPNRLLVVTKDADGSEEQLIEITLSGDDENTLLVWEERGMPVELVAAYGAGVQVHVEDLAAYLDGSGRCDAQARFEQLFPAYRELPTDSVG